MKPPDPAPGEAATSDRGWALEAMFPADDLGFYEPEARLLQTCEWVHPTGKTTTLAHFTATWPRADSHHHVHAVLWDDGAPRKKVLAVLLRLRKHGLLPAAAELINARADGTVILAVDTSDGKWLAKYNAALSRREWGAPRVVAVAFSEGDSDFAQSIGAGLYEVPGKPS